LAWETWLGAECRRGPVVLFLEDLHWGDLPSITLVDRALRTLHEHSLLVLATARPEISAVFPRLWAERDLQTIQLGPLTRKAATQLARAVLGEKVPDAVIARVVEQGAGNAFFLEELIRAVAEGNAATPPESVLAMVQCRVEMLDPAARRVLRAAS